MPYKTTIKTTSKKSVLTSDHASNFDPNKASELRDEVIDHMALYCAELSQLLLMDFAENLASQLVDLPVSVGMGRQFFEYKYRIDRDGLFSAGEEILLSMRELVGKR